MKNNDFEICSRQGEIYEYAVQKGYDLESFSNLYLKSDFCNKEMDSDYSKYHSAYYKEAIWCFMPELEGKIKLCNEKKSEWAFAEDVGFMYRLLHILTNVPSRELCEIIPFDYILNKASSFDHYGFENCALDIMEMFNLPKHRFDSQLTELTHEEAETLKAEFIKRYL